MRNIKALAPARIKWAIELLELDKQHNVLEIGCGSGVAAQHICAKLGYGNYTGLDRSPAAIKAAQERNRRYINAGRAFFSAPAPFAAADHSRSLFERLLAVNVNLFWTDDGAGAEELASLTKANSRIVLVYQPPESSQRAKIARALRKRFSPHFATITARMRTLDGAALLGVVAAREAPEHAP